jgi:hypothetical protein
VKHLYNGREFDGYRVRYEYGEFQLGADVGDHHKSKVFTIIDRSTNGIKWPAAAFPRNLRVKGIHGFNDSHSGRAGTSNVIGVCVDTNGWPTFYMMAFDGYEFFFHAGDVLECDDDVSPACTTGKLPQLDAPSLTEHVILASPPPSANSGPTAPQAEPPSPPPDAFVHVDPPTAPQVEPQRRQRKCKDCGTMFPFVARKTLCENCGVQPPSRAPRDESDSGTGSSSSDSDITAQVPGAVPGRKRKRARKFKPKEAQVGDILLVIAADCPYTHQRDSQKACFVKALRHMHKESLAQECTHWRQLKAWCDKMCEVHYNEAIATRNKSGNAEDIPKVSVLDTVAADWAEYHLRSGKTSKLNKKHAEIIRNMCIQTSTTVPDFAKAIASGREKHNAIMRTNRSNSCTPLLSSSPSTHLTHLSPPIARPNRDTLATALQMAMEPLHARAPPISAEKVQKFTADIVALERRTQQNRGSEFSSRLEGYVVTIMEKLGVECVADLDELEEGQEAAAELPVLVANRFRAILRARHAEGNL